MTPDLLEVSSSEVRPQVNVARVLGIATNTTGKAECQRREDRIARGTPAEDALSNTDFGRNRRNPHHYLPDRRSQTRGVTAFAPMADTADHWDDLQFANLVAAKIQSCYTILREMDAGAPVLPFAGGRDHSETTEIRPDGETRTLTDTASGFEIYGYKGEKRRGFVPTLPGLEFFESTRRCCWGFSP